MSTAAITPPLDQPPLSQVERVLDTYIAPTKTFLDIRRSAAWWMPFLIAVIVSGCFTVSLQKKIGWDQLTQISMQQHPSRAARLDSLTPEQRDKQIHMIAKTSQYTSYAYGVVVLILAAIVAGLFMLTCNFGLGAHATYGQYFAIWMYAALPLVIKALLATIMLWAGGGGESFDINNILGSNPGYYIDRTTISPFLHSILSSLDIFNIWTVYLLMLGFQIVGRISRGSAAAAAFGWWAISVIFFAAIAGFGA
jgi:hypothetical protein